MTITPDTHVHDPAHASATPRLRRWLRPAVAAVLAGAAVPGIARAQDPLPATGVQDWLVRVVPAGLTAPADAPPIGIIERGFDPDHPDMQGGWVALRRPGPVPSPDDVPAVVDWALDIAHGTAVAAIIGAPRDGVGMEGVLPGTRVWVYGHSGRCSDVAAAVRQAVGDGVGVINVSAGFEAAGACRQFRDAVSWAYGRGVLTIASAGNMRPNQRWIQPGSDWHVLTVGALNHLDQTTSFSQQNIAMDVTAPGEGVHTAWPTWLDDDGVTDGYRRLDGTSFSSPMVAAAAAWVMATRPRLSASQVADVLRFSARDLGRRGWDRASGWGAVDIRAALREPTPPDDPFEPNEDIRWVNGRAGFTADPPLLGRRRREVVRATLDLAEDPYDVYRVSVPIGRSARITLRSPGIRADLAVFQPSARFVDQRGQVVARSARPGTVPETVVITNGGARRPAYIDVRARRGGDLGGAYTLSIELVR